MALGERILVPYFRVSLVPALGGCLTGILILYFDFTKLIMKGEEDR
jgi:hypothetical protein